ncbi:MAG: carboxymuconolactone decarboxylase family protein [Syntrophomonadaceae bacterium]|jgi:AhpD family alkylhydroperoxidase
MANDPNQVLSDLFAGMGKINEEMPELNAAFVQMDQAAYVEGELERKYKEMIGLAIGLFTRCEYCMTLHAKNALAEGATRDEILEACAVAVAFGGSPSMAYLATTVMNALDEFE